jgi:hypothetical protein
MRKHEKKTPKIVGSQSGNLKDCFVLECVGRYSKRFEGTCRLHLQGRGVKSDSLLLWTCRKHVPLKR